MVALIESDLDRIEATLATLLVVLSADGRKRMPRVRTGFAPAARVLANLILKRPEIAAVCGYDSAAIVEDLDNVELIDPVIPRLKALLQMLEDSRLQWLAEAQGPTLQAYEITRMRAEYDGTLAEMVAPLAKVLANGPQGPGRATTPVDAPPEESTPTT